jgi:hypothetical protein
MAWLGIYSGKNTAKWNVISIFVIISVENRHWRKRQNVSRQFGGTKRKNDNQINLTN